MTKVYKSVGAVAVYSPWRAAAAVGAGLLLVAGAGFGIGAAAGDGGAAQPATRTVVRTLREPALATQVTDRAPRPAPQRVTRGYLRGYRAGATQAFGPPNDFRAGSAYVVRLRRGAHGTLRVGPHIAVVAGTRYYLCAGGLRLCMGTGGG